MRAMDVSSGLGIAIAALHYTFPALVFFYFVVSLTITVCTLQTQSLKVKDQHVRRDIILALILSIIGTYIAEAVTIVVKSWFKTKWFPGQDQIVYLIGSIIVFGVQALALVDTKFPVWYPYYGTWLAGILMEVSLIVVPNVFQHLESPFDLVVIVIQGVRICIFVVLPCLYFSLRNRREEYDNSDAERQSLLRKRLAPKPSSSEDLTSDSNGYGATADTVGQESDTAEDASDAGSEDSWLEEQQKAQELIAKRLKNDGNWWTYAKGFSIFFPYVWPMHSKTLQFRAFLVGGCLLTSNALNVLVPRQLGILIDSLDLWGRGEHANNPWLQATLYAVFYFISSGACIGWLRKWLWMPVENYSYDALSTAAHSHLMNLSSDFHDNKTTSDLSQAISGGRSVSDLLDTVCFQVFPMFIDLSIAFGYLWSLFGPYMGLIMACTVISYLYLTTKLVAMRAEKRREYITIYRKEWTVGQQGLDGWNTASLFNMIPYEQHRYACGMFAPF